MDPVNLYDTSYSNTNFRGTVHERVRLETYGQDLGQTSWMTADEFREFLEWPGRVADEDGHIVGRGRQETQPLPQRLNTFLEAGDLGLYLGRWSLKVWIPTASR